MISAPKGAELNWHCKELRHLRFFYKTALSSPRFDDALAGSRSAAID
jgi:hypothetical protein